MQMKESEYCKGYYY